MITILHTNDIHGHLRSWQGWEGDLAGREVGGLDRLARAVADVRAESSHTLLLDAGDLVGDTMIAQLTQGNALIQVANEIGYDALAVGNHEPDHGAERLQRLMDASKCPLLAANLETAERGTLIAEPSLAKTFGDIRVGVFGLAYPKTSWTTAPKNVASLRFTDPLETAQASVKRLRAQGADVVIALTHLGLAADRRLAEQAPGIDVIVGGHSHNRMAQALRVGDTLIVQAGAHGSDLGRLDLEVRQGVVVGHKRTLYPLVSEAVRAEKRVTALIDEIEAPYRSQLDEQLGQAAEPLVRAQTLAGQEPRKRADESPVDSLFADILRNETGADVALLPGVGYGVAIPAGPIRAAQLRQLVPHDGDVVTVELQGEQIRQILERAVDNVFTDDMDHKVGGMIQVSGLRFEYDPSQARGRRVQKVQLDEGRWDPAQVYRVATNSMLAAGGHRQETFKQGRERREHGSQFEMIKNYFKKQSSVGPPDGGRIQRLGSDSNH